MNLVSLFSGCGGMDIGFEGDFFCLKKSINLFVHPEWVEIEKTVIEIMKLIKRFVLWGGLF